MTAPAPEPLSQRAWDRLRGVGQHVGSAVEVPEPVATARHRSTRRAVISGAVLIAVVALVLVARAVWTAAHTEIRPAAQAREPVVGAAPVGAAPTGGSASRLVVHVVGAVRRPGVVDLPAGARVGDAVRAAGGLTAQADPVALNLARSLSDGEQVRVPLKGESVTGAGSPTPGGVGGGGTPRVSLNSADLAALDSLPGVGPVLASRVIEWRRAHGRFTSVDELGEVTGIGDRLLEQLRPLVAL